MVAFVRNKKDRLFQDWAADRKARGVLLQRQTRETERVVFERIRIQCFVTKKVKASPVKLFRSTACAQIDAPTRRATVLGRELICNHLYFRYSLERRLKAFACCTVVVVVESVDRQVVGVRWRARERKRARFFRRVGVIDVAIFSEVAR